MADEANGAAQPAQLNQVNTSKASAEGKGAAVQGALAVDPEPQIILMRRRKL